MPCAFAGLRIQCDEACTEQVVARVKATVVIDCHTIGRNVDEVAFGVLDITLYRDDLSTIAPQPVVKETVFPVPIDDRVVVLCDDVLYTGRTIRAALDALVDYGRPRAVRLAVVIDRGHRELPIQADFVGKSVQTEDDEVVEVRFEETDGHDGVHLMRRDQIELANRTGGSDGAGEEA
jgi:pyrimidine operon attenuation protein/uracil phosphoribosyltransferase